MFVFFRKNYFVIRYAPVNMQVGVVPCDSSFTLRSVEVVTFVLEDDFGSEYAESVGEASWNEELAVIVLGEFYGYVLSEGGRTFTDVYGYIEHGTFLSENDSKKYPRSSLKRRGSMITTPSISVLIMFIL